MYVLFSLHGCVRQACRFSGFFLILLRRLPRHCTALGGRIWGFWAQRVAGVFPTCCGRASNMFRSRSEHVAGKCGICCK